MKASEVKMALRWQMEANNPVHIEGEYGVGKTSVVTQATAEAERELLISRLGLCESVDLRGLPATDAKTGTTRWLTPSDFPKAGCKPTSWFFDEWRQALPSVQAAAGQLLNERRLGDYKVPDNVYLCAASNRAKDRSATNKMPAHVSSRFVHLTMEADAGDWCAWAAGPGDVAVEVIAFIRWKPELLSKVDPNADASPNCRAWGDYVSRATKKAAGLKLPSAVEMQTYSGMVGAPAASEYMGFLQVYRGLPDPQAMLMNPDGCAIPDKPDVLCALGAVLARKATTSNMDRIVKIADRMPEEFGVLLVTNATLLKPEVSGTKGFVAWAEKHQYVLN